MKRHLYTLLLSLLFFCAKAEAQDTLGIGQYSYSIGNDTVSAYSNDSVSFWVINYGSTVFNDQLWLLTEVNDTSGALFHGVDTTITPLITILPGDSALVSLACYYDMDVNYRYHYDINVIVIWPYALSTSITIISKLQYNKYIVIAQSVSEINLLELIRAYPNPSTQTFTVENKGKNSIEEVRIHDPGGRLVFITKDPSSICVESWKKGIYLATLIFENKETATIRIIKQ